MKLRILNWLIIFSIIILAGNGIIGYLVYQSNQKLSITEQWVQHTERIISLSGSILSFGIDIETSSRGFIITNDSTFLEPLVKAEKIIFVNIIQLGQLTRDNNIQQKRVDSLNLYMHLRLDYSKQSVEIRNKHGLAAAIAFTSTKNGKYFTDRLRQITNTIQHQETILLNERKKIVEQSVSVLNRSSVIMFILMEMFTILLIIGTGKYMFQHKEKEKRAAELIIANKELDYQNEEKDKRAAELIIATKELDYQNEEKDKRAAELIIANEELAFQNEEKEKRAAELIIANEELVFQNMEKEKRADELIIANKELVFQNEEKEKRAEELIIANEELVFQNEEKEKRAAELVIANKKLAYQNEEREKRAEELIIAYKELVFQNEEKEKRAAELKIADKELAYQTGEKEKRAAELKIADKELAYQTGEKAKRAAELKIADIELAYQSEEKEKRAAELKIADIELAYQSEEKEKRAAELIIADKELVYQSGEKAKRAAELKIAGIELAFQSEEKDKRAAELKIADIELAYQSEEKDKRAAELKIADKELAYQSKEKEKRAAELIIADKELAYQSEEKGKRADELIIANIELDFQNEEKGKRADELIIANIELDFQNEEKEKRAAELKIADKELAFQSREKDKRAAELIIVNKELDFQQEEKEKQVAANKELEAFSYSVSHDLRAPLRHIGGFIDLLIKNNSSQLNEAGIRYLNIISESAIEMGNLIDALLTFSRLSRAELQRTRINTKSMVARVLKTFTEELSGRNVEIKVSELPDIMGDENLINQVWINLISNALKYSRKEEHPIIEIGAETKSDDIIFYIRDNGVGFDMKFADKLFGVFQRLHKAKDFEGIGIGLANVNRIVVRHGGLCSATGVVGKGATFSFSLPINNK